ncbi:APC family permease [Yinghuangia seranimata]|uniref:APC family permease n=1 Tax=Yinghuangia seranimata TaxID=408067 RepID=UPI00248AA5D2|nr:APC family permease [Yinghuangia seranimata]MDI2129670.1 APC family permease [Yinghuangia seranimata]
MSAGPRPDAAGGLNRRIGLFQATAINMSQMCGIGPFVTIPIMVGTFGGPQAILGFLAGAVLALADGLVWAELGAAMPGAGGTYVYLREAFQYRTGRLMPFLFVWTAMLFIPLIMSTGVLGLVQYLEYLWPSMTETQGDVVGVGVVVLVIALLWRRIESIGLLTSVMWVVMVVSVTAVIIASYTNFDADLAFTYPRGAFDVGTSTFWLAFIGGLNIGIYDYLGYNTTAYIGSEIKQPGRILPRATVYSIVAIAAIYLVMQIGVLGVTDTDTITGSSSIGSLVLEKAWGTGAAKTITVLILITAFASVFTGLLGGSRVPYDAARDKVFFTAFGRLHPKHKFPTLGLLAMGVVTAAGFLIGHHTDFNTIIVLLTAVMVIVQAVAQIAALVVLRRRQPDLKRPYRMWLYPVPALVALAGWVAIFCYADKNSPGRHPIEWSLVWVAAGCVAFLVWAKVERTWPFGGKDIVEQYRGAATLDSVDGVDGVAAAGTTSAEVV